MEHIDIVILITQLDMESILKLYVLCKAINQKFKSPLVINTLCYKFNLKPKQVFHAVIREYDSSNLNRRTHLRIGVDECFVMAANQNNTAIMARMITLGLRDFDYMEDIPTCYDFVVSSCIDNNPNRLMTQCINRNMDDFVWAAHTLGATNQNKALRMAILQDKVSIVELLIKLGVTPTIEDTIEALHSEQADRLSELLTVNYDDCLIAAAKLGRYELIGHLAARGARSFNKAMKAAVKSNQAKHIIESLTELGANNHNECLLMAIKRNIPGVIGPLIKLGNVDIENGLQMAARLGNRNMVNQLIQLGACNYSDAAIAARRAGYRDLALRLNNRSKK